MSRLATFYDHVRDISRQENISFADALCAVRKLGIDCLEIQASRLVGREDEIGNELAFADMGVSSIPAYFDFGRNSDVSAQADPVLEAAAYLKADRILVIPGFIDTALSPEEKENELVRMIEGTNIFAEKAKSFGISAVMEDYDSVNAPFSTIDGLSRFFDECPELSCAFDTGNFIYSGEDVLTAYEKFKDRITHVHLKDRALSSDKKTGMTTAVTGTELYASPVGEGIIPIKELITRLKNNGYDGIYNLEHANMPDSLKRLESSAAWVKSLL